MDSWDDEPDLEDDSDPGLDLGLPRLRVRRLRLARVTPLHAAIGDLELSPEQAYPLGSIVVTVEAQMRTDDDNPEVVQALLEALRLAVRHRVGEVKGRAMLEAVAALERAEALRNAPSERATIDLEARIDELVAAGDQRLTAGDTVGCCEQWLAAWELAGQIPHSGAAGTLAWDEPAIRAALRDLAIELDEELAAAAARDPAFHERQLTFAREALEHFPDLDDENRLGFLQSQAAALWHLGRHAESAALYADAARQYPDHAWSYLGWAAHYWSEEDGIREFGRAEEILKQGLERPELDERLEILGALEELYGAWGKRRERREMHELARRLDVTGWPPSVPTLTVVGQGTPGGPFVRPSRNAPCWCGSGRKYKKCHFDSDEAGLEG